MNRSQGRLGTSLTVHRPPSPRPRKEQRRQSTLSMMVNICYLVAVGKSWNMTTKILYAKTNKYIYSQVFTNK